MNPWWIRGRIDPGPRRTNCYITAQMSFAEYLIGLKVTVTLWPIQQVAPASVMWPTCLMWVRRQGKSRAQALHMQVNAGVLHVEMYRGLRAHSAAFTQWGVVRRWDYDSKHSIKLLTYSFSTLHSSRFSQNRDWILFTSLTRSEESPGVWDFYHVFSCEINERDQWHFKTSPNRAGAAAVFGFSTMLMFSIHFLTYWTCGSLWVRRVSLRHLISRKAYIWWFRRQTYTKWWFFVQSSCACTRSGGF